MSEYETRAFHGVTEIAEARPALTDARKERIKKDVANLREANENGSVITGMTHFVHLQIFRL